MNGNYDKNDSTRYSAFEETKAIKDYFKRNNMHYVPVVVMPKSNHPDDKALFEVVAESTINKGTYAAWTSWNAARQDLNCGHYDIVDLKDALDVIHENFHDGRPSLGEKSFEEISFERAAYAIYKSEWVAQNIPPSEYFDEVEFWKRKIDKNEEDYTFEEWLEECGFSGCHCYVSFESFLNSEFMDSEEHYRNVLKGKEDIKSRAGLDEEGKSAVAWKDGMTPIDITPERAGRGSNGNRE